MAERPWGPHEAWQEANFNKLPQKDFNGICTHLIHELDDSILKKWREQDKRGVAIGSDDPNFSSTAGDVIRTLCRNLIPDNELPWVSLDETGAPINPPRRTWDDSYMGAIAGAVTGEWAEYLDQLP
jgi:hypothetical protein